MFWGPYGRLATELNMNCIKIFLDEYVSLPNEDLDQSRVRPLWPGSLLSVWEPNGASSYDGSLNTVRISFFKHEAT